MTTQINRGRAFTLAELLVVLAIFVLILAIGVPAFSSMMYSSEQALAESSLRIGLAAGRDAAVRSGRGRDGGAFFFYDSAGRLTIVPAVSAGVLLDDPLPGPFQSDGERREIFAADATMQAVQMPRGWMVRGLTLANTIDATWYEKTYANREAVPNWVFPETGFFRQSGTTAGLDGRDRQTFFVRFEGGTGKLITSDQTPVLVFSPSPASEFRSLKPWSDYRADREADPARLVRRVLASGLSRDDKRKLLGDRSSDTALARPVCALAVYNERRLAAFFGARISPATGSLYEGPQSNGEWDPDLVAGVRTEGINEWIDGTQPGGDARVFTVQRYLGQAQDVRGAGDGGASR